jgi:uncharacterized membrane protein
MTDLSARKNGHVAERCRIADHIRSHGPVPGNELAAALGMTLDEFWVLINDKWFTVTGRGWVLTRTGEAESRAKSRVSDAGIA